ncbi:hypothetical protein ACLOJK_033088 [Asimina triloba]
MEQHSPGLVTTSCRLQIKTWMFGRAHLLAYQMLCVIIIMNSFHQQLRLLRYFSEFFSAGPSISLFALAAPVSISLFALAAPVSISLFALTYLPQKLQGIKSECPAVVKSGILFSNPHPVKLHQIKSWNSSLLGLPELQNLLAPGSDRPTIPFTGGALKVELVDLMIVCIKRPPKSNEASNTLWKGCRGGSNLSTLSIEKIALIQERDSLLKENERLNHEKDSFLKNKDLADGQIIALTKSLESIQRELKDREKQVVQELKQLLDLQRKELNDCRAEITSLKMHIEGSRSGRRGLGRDTDNVQASIDNYKEEIKSLKMEIESLKSKKSLVSSTDFNNHQNEDLQTEERVVEIHEDKTVTDPPPELTSGVPDVEDGQLQTSKDSVTKLKEDGPQPVVGSLNGDVNFENDKNVHRCDSGLPPKDNGQVVKADNRGRETTSEKMSLETIQILSDALPKIVPYVLINHREELLPLIMCAIERHPDSSIRDSLTHTLFNLIKRPDEQQRRIIMDACVTLAKNVGEMRTESELLPQCWEQINHMYEERRLLVAQSCGELAEFVRPEIRDSLILSIVQQLIEDSATVVREAAAHNLALLLPLFPNMDKYFKVEELMFQLVCDPSGVVVETSLKELVPAVINWGNKLDHILRVLLSHILSSAQRCPPASGVEESVDSQLRVLGERERWNIDVLLRMLTELLPFVHRKAVETCPFPSATSSEPGRYFFTTSLLELYAGILFVIFSKSSSVPILTGFSNLGTTLQLLLNVSDLFGDQYLTYIMLPIFFIALGDGGDLSFFPSAVQSRIKGLRPKTALAEKLATMSVLPLLLAGILGSPSRHEQLADYLRKLLVQNTTRDDSWSMHRTAEVIDAVRFLWLIPYIDEKVASTHVLPALVTLGSDQNLNVKYASIDAFGIVAQHFKTDTIVDKIRVQMDAFLEDGSHEATIAVVHALVVASTHLLSKIFQLTNMPTQGTDVVRRRTRASTFCEAIRALDATDVPANSVREFLLPSIQNMLKDPDALDPAHKEALEITMKERSGGTLETISKVMGAHLGIPSSVTSFFGESGLLGKRDSGDPIAELASTLSPTTPAATAATAATPQQPPPEDTTFRRIMRGNFGDMLRGKGRTQDDASQKS